MSDQPKPTKGKNVFSKMKKSLSLSRAGSFTSQMNNSYSIQSTPAGSPPTTTGTTIGDEPLLAPFSNSPRSDAASEDRIHALDVKVRDLESERYRLEKLAHALDADLTGARKACEDLETQLKEVTKKNQAASAALDSQRAGDERIRTELSTSLTAAEEDNLKLKRALAARDLEIAEVQAALNAATNTMDDLNNAQVKAAAAQEQATAEAQARIAKAEKKADMLDKTVKAQESAAAAAALKSQADVNRLTSRIAHLQDELKAKDSEVQEVAGKMQRLEVEVAAQGEVAAQNKDKMEGLIKELEDAKKGLKDVESDLNEEHRSGDLIQGMARSSIDKLSQDVLAAEKQVEELKAAIQVVTREKEEALEAQRVLEERVLKLEQDNAILHNELALDAISLDDDPAGRLPPSESMLSNFGVFKSENDASQTGVMDSTSSSILGAPAHGTITIGAAIGPTSPRTTAKGPAPNKDHGTEDEAQSFVLQVAGKAGKATIPSGKHAHQLLLKKTLPRMTTNAGKTSTDANNNNKGTSPRKLAIHAALGVVTVMLGSKLLRGGSARGNQSTKNEWEQYKA